MLLIFLILIAFSFDLLAKKAAIIVDFETNEVLFEKNADTKNYPASLTKIKSLFWFPLPTTVKGLLLIFCDKNTPNIAP